MMFSTRVVISHAPRSPIKYDNGVNLTSKPIAYAGIFNLSIFLKGCRGGNKTMYGNYTGVYTRRSQ